MDTPLRPMTTSQVLDRTFSLYRSHFVMFVGIAIVAPALALLGQLAQLPFLGRGIMLTPQSTPSEFGVVMLRTVISFVVAVIVGVIGFSLASGATVQAVSMVHLGRPASIYTAYSWLRSSFGRVVGIGALLNLIAFGPLIVVYSLFIFLALFMASALRGGSPGAGQIAVIGGGFLLLAALIAASFAWMIYAYVRFSLAVPACVVEGLKPLASLRRGSSLSVGSRWRILLVAMLMLLITAAFKSVLEIPAILFTFKNILRAPATPPGLPALLWIYAAEFIGSALAGPILTVAISLLYYDQRVRKEAFDLQLMMDSMGQAPAAPPVVSSAASIG